ncbi:MAG: biotin--[acetyl-CoA-carboxylase] ligase [Bacteroidales bacterium]|nr:biotin--[acetyl-CoA-carboxylase] ligase [Bacteroidales bacterium]
MSIQFNIKTVNETVSTNLLMKEWEKENRLNHGDVLRAIHQTAGIGQSGNVWESEAGMNLTFSLFLKTDFIAASELFQINKLISLAVNDYLVEKGIHKVKIKWPNDLYVGDCKIAGMLTHNSFLGDKLEHSIVGLGLNINQMKFKSDTSNPISLKQILGDDADLEVELKNLLQSINRRFSQLERGDIGRINADYLNCLYGLNEKKIFKDASGTFEGIIQGVDLYGRLLIEKELKIRSTYNMKEIEFL